MGTKNVGTAAIGCPPGAARLGVEIDIYEGHSSKPCENKAELRSADSRGLLSPHFSGVA